MGQLEWYDQPPGVQLSVEDQVAASSSAPAQVSWVHVNHQSSGSDLVGDLEALDLTVEGVIVEGDHYFQDPSPVLPLPGLELLTPGGNVSGCAMHVPIGTYAISSFLAPQFTSPGAPAGLYQYGINGQEAAAASGALIYLPDNVLSAVQQMSQTTNIVESAPGADDAYFYIWFNVHGIDGSSLAPIPYDSYNLWISIEQIRAWTPVYT